MDKFLKVIGYLGLCVGYIFYRLFVLRKIWGYIAVKMFGLPQVSMWQMFAISYIANMLTSDFESDDVRPEERAKKLASSFAAVSVAWLICYLFFG